MATSGSIDLTATGTNIITEAMELLGVLEDGGTVSANELTTGSRTLNYMVKAWQTRGLNLFALQRVYVYLEKNKHEYSLGPSGDHFSTEKIQTQLNGSHDAADTTLTVDSITDINASDNIGVALTDGTVQWTTVSGSPSGTTVTLATGLTSAASDDAYIHVYTTKANRPMRIINAFVRDTSNNDIPIEVVARQDYVDLTLKTSDGQVNTVYYDPQIGTGVLYTWPETDDVTDVLVLRVQRTLEDIDTVATDDLDFPGEWFESLSTNLALRLAPKYGVSSEVFAQLKYLANEALFDAESGDIEDQLQLVPDIRRDDL